MNKLKQANKFKKKDQYSELLQYIIKNIYQQKMTRHAKKQTKKNVNHTEGQRKQKKLP